MSCKTKCWILAHAIVSVSAASSLSAVLFVATGLCDESKSVTFALPHFEELLIVPVTISGEEHLFVLDSGSSVNVLHTDLRKCLGESIRAHKDSFAANEEGIKSKVYRHPVAFLGELPIARNAPVALIDLTTMRSAIGRDIQGILGMPFFATNIIQVDFDRRELRIIPLSTAPTEEWGRSIAVVYTKSNLPVVHSVFGEEAGEPTIVDTGFSGTLSLRSDVFTSLMRKGGIAPIGDATVAKVSTFQKRQTGVLSKFELSGHSHNDLLVMRRNGNDWSYIGLNYLRRYTVTFDLGQERIFLARGDGFYRPDREPRVGIGMLRLDGKTVVVMIDPNSPAERAGFQIDDELISVEGENVAEKPFAEIRWMLRKNLEPDGSLQIEIRRKDAIRLLVVKLDE